MPYERKTREKKCRLVAMNPVPKWATHAASKFEIQTFDIFALSIEIVANLLSVKRFPCEGEGDSHLF